MLTISLCFGSAVSGAAVSPSIYTNGNPNSSSTSSLYTESGPIISQSYQTEEIISFGKFNNQSLTREILEIRDGHKALLFATDIHPDIWLPFDKTSNIEVLSSWAL